MPGIDDKSTGLQKPSDAKKPVDEPVIHVIPETFYGAGLKTKVPPLQPAAPIPGAPILGTPPVPVAPKKKGPRIAIIAAIGVFLLLGIAGAAYFLTRPAPTPIVNTPVPPRAVCGDAKCDAPSETPSNCSADCGAPAPVCGDAKCDEPTETSQNCPADCGVAAPVCGDGVCAETETSESCSADCKPPEPKPGEDRDSDGLSDQEEREVFGTDPSSPNTDHDSFVDLNEALNLFDPALPSPAMLRDSKKIAAYSNVALHFTMLRPASWTAKETDGQPMFTAPSGEFVAVTTAEKTASQGIMDWYLAQAPGVTSSQVEPYKTRNGLDAILSPDRLTAYVDFGTEVVVVSYNLANQPQVQYRVTFQMMVQSLLKI